MEEKETFMQMDRDYRERVFKVVYKWSIHEANQTSKAKLVVVSVPLHAWSEETFLMIDDMWGIAIRVDPSTLSKANLEAGCILISTEHMGIINRPCELKCYVVDVYPLECFILAAIYYCCLKVLLAAIYWLCPAIGSCLLDVLSCSPLSPLSCWFLAVKSELLIWILSLGVASWSSGHISVIGLGMISVGGIVSGYQSSFQAHWFSFATMGSFFIFALIRRFVAIMGSFFRFAIMEVFQFSQNFAGGMVSGCQSSFQAHWFSFFRGLDMISVGGMVSLYQSSFQAHCFSFVVMPKTFCCGFMVLFCKHNST
ncbi:hypothetical protein U1Q18_015899 [Sarracenia purpurea var. burkii]